MDPGHPLFQSVALPLATAFVGAALVRVALGRETGSRVACAASGLGLLLAALAMLGVPSGAPRSAMEKLPVVFAVGLVIGIALDLAAARTRHVVVAGAAGFAASCVWLAWPQLSGGGTRMLGALAIGWVVGAAAIWSLATTRERGATGPSTLVAAGVGLAGAAFGAASLALSQLVIAVAAAAGGFALWNWPRARYPFGASGVLGPGMGALVIGLATGLLTDVRPVVLLVLALCFAAPLLAAKLPAPGRVARDTVEPLYAFGIALVPAVIALWLAQPGTTAGSPYYR